MDNNISINTFDTWNIEKKRLHNNGTIRTIKEGEIWWCGVGQNIGTEKTGSWYASFIFKDRKETAVLIQTRNFSIFRLHSCIGQIPNSDLNFVKQELKKIYLE